MNSLVVSNHDNAIDKVKTRHVNSNDNPTALADIYQEEFNIVIWERHLCPQLQQ